MGMDAYISIDNKIFDCYKARKMCTYYYNCQETFKNREILVYTVADSGYGDTTLAIFVVTEDNNTRSKFIKCAEDKRDRNKLIGIMKIRTHYDKPFKVIAFLINSCY